MSRLKTSLFKILKPEQLKFNYATIVILCLTVIVKVWQSIFNKKIGTLINSHSLIATSTDSRNDVIITSTTIISLFCFKFFNINLDAYFGFFVSLFLIYSGFKLAKETLSPLLGEAINEELANKIRNIATGYENVFDVHDILVHNYGPNKSIGSLHVEVPSHISINDSHQIVDLIEDRVKEELGILLTIHIDPVNLKDERLICLRKTLINILQQYDERLDSHDHRLVDRENSTNFIFDLVIPYNFSKEKEKELILSIKENISKLDKNYKCIINIENSFIK